MYHAGSARPPTGAPPWDFTGIPGSARRIVEVELEARREFRGDRGSGRLGEVGRLPLDPDNQARIPRARYPLVFLERAPPHARCAFPLLVEILGLDRRPGPRIPPQVRRGVRRRELRVLDRLPDLARELERGRQELARHEPPEAPEGAEGARGPAQPAPGGPGHAFLLVFLFPAHRDNLIGTVSSGRFSACESCESARPA